jgi:hypothetical protein
MIPPNLSTRSGGAALGKEARSCNCLQAAAPSTDRSALLLVAAVLCSWLLLLVLLSRYDAGDNVKFNFPMAWSAHVLTWSIVDFADVSADRA